MSEYELFLRLLAERVYTDKGLGDASDFHTWLLELSKKAAEATTLTEFFAGWIRVANRKNIGPGHRWGHFSCATLLLVSTLFPFRCFCLTLAVSSPLHQHLLPR